MNVRAQMNVSSMRCAPIQRALTSVDVEKVSRAMEEIVQVSTRVRHCCSLLYLIYKLMII